jgi:predicted NUDIX family phosphoesterase
VVYHRLRFFVLPYGRPDIKKESMKYQEHILVVPREVLQAAGIPVSESVFAKEGLACLRREVERVVSEQGLFLPRYAMEQDPTYKQIIPYMVFVYERSLFVMQRSEQAGEQRLANAYTVGIGGHVREDDVAAGGLAEWGRRECMEEVIYDGAGLDMHFFGIVNDESNAVGIVHLGLVFVLHAAVGVITVRSELKSGMLMNRAQCLSHYSAMETWSQQVVNALIQYDYI